MLKKERKMTNQVVSMFESRRSVVELFTRTQKKEGRAGRVIIDRGVVLLQRDMVSGIWFFSLFSKGKTDDSDPDFVIPLGQIESADFKYVGSKNHKKGLVRMETKFSIDTKWSMEPMCIEMYVGPHLFASLCAFCQTVMAKGDQEKLITYDGKDPLYKDKENKA